MRKLVAFFVILAALGGGGYAAGKRFAPCSPPMLAVGRYVDRSLDRPAAECSGDAAVAAKPEVVEAPPPAVTVASVTKHFFVDRLFVSGTLVAREEALVSPRIDGLSIVGLYAEDGDHVAAGQILARLDNSQLEALLAQNDAATQRADAAIDQTKSQIEQADAQVGLASDDFNRAQKLGGQVIAVATIEQRQTALKTARAQFDAARHALAVAQADRLSRDAERKELLVRLDRTEVKAPVEGVVSRRTARIGATVAISGEPLFRIIANGAIDLDADVPEQFVARLAVGMPAKLKLPGVVEAVNAKVRLISEEIDKSSRTGKVRFALEPGAPARIGAFASGEVEIAASDGLAIPATAVQRDGAGAQALVVKNGVVEARKIELGITEGDLVEAKSGLGEGESVVARAAAFLRPGDRVRPLAAMSAAGANSASALQ